MTALRYSTFFNPKLRDFDVVFPETVEEAVAAHGAVAESEYLAGGTALLSTRYARKLQPERLVSLNRISALRELRRIDGALSVGPLCPLNELAESPELLAVAPAVAAGCGTVGAHQVRNRGTIGGNICNGASAADLVAPLLASDAVAVYTDGRREQRIPATGLWREPNDTSASRVSVLTAIELPEREGWSAAFSKNGLRRALELGMVNVAVALERSADGAITDARVAVAGLNFLPYRSAAAEQALLGEGDGFEQRTREAGRLAAEAMVALEAREDFRVSRSYQRRVLPVYVHRVALAAAEQPFTSDREELR